MLYKYFICARFSLLMSGYIVPHVLNIITCPKVHLKYCFILFIIYKLTTIWYICPYAKMSCGALTEKYNNVICDIFAQAKLFLDFEDTC